MKNYIQIGKLVATHGVNGMLVLRHHMGKKTSFKHLQAVFIENMPGSFLPYFVSEWKVKNEQEVLVKIEEINTREFARDFLQKQVWLPDDDFQKYVSKRAPISMLGFHMIHQGEDLGEIIEIIEQPMQVLCKLIFHGKEILVPINEETLRKVDKKSRKIFVNLPDGLLDVYR